MSKYLKASSVRRNDSHKELVVHFNHMPTDEQLEEFFEWVREFQTQAEIIVKINTVRSMR